MVAGPGDDQMEGARAASRWGEVPARLRIRRALEDNRAVLSWLTGGRALPPRHPPARTAAAGAPTWGSQSQPPGRKRGRAGAAERTGAWGRGSAAAAGTTTSDQRWRGRRQQGRPGAAALPQVTSSTSLSDGIGAKRRRTAAPGAAAQPERRPHCLPAALHAHPGDTPRRGPLLSEPRTDRQIKQEPRQPAPVSPARCEHPGATPRDAAPGPAATPAYGLAAPVLLPSAAGSATTLLSVSTQPPPPPPSPRSSHVPSDSQLPPFDLQAAFEAMLRGWRLELDAHGATDTNTGTGSASPRDGCGGCGGCGQDRVAALSCHCSGRCCSCGSGGGGGGGGVPSGTATSDMTHRPAQRGRRSPCPRPGSPPRSPGSAGSGGGAEGGAEGGRAATAAAAAAAATTKARPHRLAAECREQGRRQPLGETSPRPASPPTSPPPPPARPNLEDVTRLSAEPPAAAAAAAAAAECGPHLGARCSIAVSSTAPPHAPQPRSGKHDLGDPERPEPCTDSDTDVVLYCDLTSERTIQEVQATLSHSAELLAEDEPVVMVPQRAAGRAGLAAARPMMAIRKSASATTARWAEGRVRGRRLLDLRSASVETAASAPAAERRPTPTAPCPAAAGAHTVGDAASPETVDDASPKAADGDAASAKAADADATLTKAADADATSPKAADADATSAKDADDEVIPPKALGAPPPSPGRRPSGSRTCRRTAATPARCCAPRGFRWSVFAAASLVVPLLFVAAVLLRMQCDPGLPIDQGDAVFHDLVGGERAGQPRGSAAADSSR